MKRIAVVMVLLLAGIAGYGIYTLGVNHGMASHASAAPGAHDANAGRKVLYYHDPMVPGTRFDKPGKSPFMDMQLVPVYADSEADAGTLSISPRIQQNLGVRTATVVTGAIAPQLSVVGGIAYNERDQVVVQARAAGYVERLYVRATLDPIAKGQPLVDLYVPEWIAAQEEFLSVRRMHGAGLDPLVDAALQRMRQLGMNTEQIRRVETSGAVQPRITLTAPIAGVAAELMVREGMTVSVGTPLFRINGIATVWANAEIPESQASLVRVGAAVQARHAGIASPFDGKVQAILPDVNAATRTLKARVELANPQGTLVPGMFVQMQFTDRRPDKALLVPTEAVIETGRRTVVMLAEGDGHFRPVDVEAGVESAGQTEIRRGLQEGQRVVVSGQFLIDSEASLRGVEARLNAAAPAATAATQYAGDGKIESISATSMTLSHGPVPALQWGAMTMEFTLPPDGAPPGVRPGDRVHFEFTLGADHSPQLTRVTPGQAEQARP